MGAFPLEGAVSAWLLWVFSSGGGAFGLFPCAAGFPGQVRLPFRTVLNCEKRDRGREASGGRVRGGRAGGDRGAGGGECAVTGAGAGGGCRGGGRAGGRPGGAPA